MSFGGFETRISKAFEAEEYFSSLHDNQGQRYGDKRELLYSFHLELVVKQAELFKNLVKEQDWENVIIGCWGHDSIEDARLTYNDIVKKYGSAAADIIYCCTEEKGKNRAERHSDKYLKELAANPLAVFVKLCDLIANVKYSLLTNSSMYKKYQTEYTHFYAVVSPGNEHLKEMFEYLDDLFTVGMK